MQFLLSRSSEDRVLNMLLVPEFGTEQLTLVKCSQADVPMYQGRQNKSLQMHVK
jgi:hypothetical protein